MVVITKYDRLARSLPDLTSLVETIKAKGAHFRLLTEDVDTSTPSGALTFLIFGSIAQFQRGTHRRAHQRTPCSGQEARPRHWARPAHSPDQQAETRRMRDKSL